MYIPVAKSCAVREAGGPEYKRHQTVLRESVDTVDHYKRSMSQTRVNHGIIPCRTYPQQVQQQQHHTSCTAAVPNPASHNIMDLGEEKLNAAIQIQINHRRRTHKLSEQRRRKILNARFEDLRDLIPACRDTSHTKQTILSKVLQYIEQVLKSIKNQEESIKVLSKEKERQAQLAREHAMWQRRIEYMRKGYEVNHAASMHHFNVIQVPATMTPLTMPKIPTEAM